MLLRKLRTWQLKSSYLILRYPVASYILLSFVSTQILNLSANKKNQYVKIIPKNRIQPCFRKIQKLNFFEKHPKLFCLYLSNQISLRGRFVFKTNGRISSITSCKDHCCSIFTSWVIKQQKSCILNILEKTPNFGRMVRTLDYT